MAIFAGIQEVRGGCGCFASIGWMFGWARSLLVWSGGAGFKGYLDAGSVGSGTAGAAEDLLSWCSEVGQGLRGHVSGARAARTRHAAQDLVAPQLALHEHVVHALAHLDYSCNEESKSQHSRYTYG